MKGREYSRPVIAISTAPGRSERSFNEGAGIFPPGVGDVEELLDELDEASMKGREYSRPVR